jgi:hypothetical protein
LVQDGTEVRTIGYCHFIEVLLLLYTVEPKHRAVVELITVLQTSRHEQSQPNAEYFCLAGLDTWIYASLDQSIVDFFRGYITEVVPK